VENDVPERIENPPASKGYVGELAANILIQVPLCLAVKHKGIN